MAGRGSLAAVLRHLVLLVLVALTLYPVYQMVITSFKDNPQFYSNFLSLSWPLHLSNYSVAWEVVNQYILNSIIVTAATVILVVIFSALAAYAFARMQFVGKELLYYLIIALLMIPPILTLIPQFILVKNFNMLDSWWALILPYTSGGVAFSIFVLRAFLSTLPDELFEAAHLDGASELQVFWYLGLPLIRPAVSTVAILQMLNTWNDYIWPSVVLFSNHLFTLPLGLVAFQGRYANNLGPLTAGYTIASIPMILLFAVATRSFMEGLTQGGLKL